MNICRASGARKAFSAAAPRYDHFSSLQQTIGLELLNKVPDKPYRRILDIGMGTGWLTEKCAQRFAGAETTGLDHAPGMVARARARAIDRVLEADAQQLPFEDGHFDLVISNCVYQWVEDLPRAFGESARVLSPDGDFVFTCFGSSTLKELREAIDHGAPERPTTLHPWHLLSKEHMGKALEKAGFQRIAISADVRKETFDDLWSLIHWLKAIGANRVKRDRFIGRQSLAKASAYYQDHFAVHGGVSASFEIISGAARL